jgi:hypothetical protein
MQITEDNLVVIVKHLVQAVRSYSRDRIAQAIIEKQVSRGIYSGAVKVGGETTEWNAALSVEEK